MILNKKAIGACMIASQDTLRPALACVKIEEKRMIGADGYKMIIIERNTEVNNFNHEDLPNMGTVVKNEEYLLNASQLKVALQRIPKKTDLPILKNIWTIESERDNQVKVISTDLSSNSIDYIEKCDANYPNVDIIIPTSEPIATISFSIPYMIELLKAIDIAGAKETSSIVTVEIHDKLAPIMLRSIDSNKNKITGLLMPVRVENR